MIGGNKGWNTLFWFCFGLFAGTAFCMKWMEGDFQVNGEKFTVIGLEISYSKEKLAALLSGMDEAVKKILRYHLSFDFAFMAGVYPGIAALCMMGSTKTNSHFFKKVLLILALLQILAWGCDIAENILLLQWIKQPVIGREWEFYHLIVGLKWVIALLGALLAIPIAMRKRKSG